MRMPRHRALFNTIAYTYLYHTIPALLCYLPLDLLPIVRSTYTCVTFGNSSTATHGRASDGDDGGVLMGLRNVSGLGGGGARIQQRTA